MSMDAGEQAPPPRERLVPAVVKRDTGPGLVEAPLRAGSWIGFAGSWLLLAAGSTGLFAASLLVLGVGGFCGDGGPYEIAVRCPEGSGRLLAGSVPMIAASVLLGVFGARGLGTPVHGFFWSALFGLEGVAFLIAAFGPRDPAAGFPVGWLVCGALFALLAALPAPLARIGWPRSVFGRRRLDGRSLVNHGLPVRDAVVLAAVWAGSVAAGVGGGLLLVGLLA